MKGKLLTIGFSTVIISLLMCSVVHASWSTLETGYAVTSNYQQFFIPSGTPVTITAGTLDSTVTSVTFRWLASPYESDDCLLDETVPVYTNGTIGHWNNGTPAEIWYADSTYVVSQGVWKVEILFTNSEGETNTAELYYWLGVIDYDSSFPVPEEPPFRVPEIALGTIGASVAMAAALGLFMIKKKRQQK